MKRALILMLVFVPAIVGARPITLSWDAVPTWPAGTVVEAEINGVSASGITGTQHVFELSVFHGDTLNAKARAIAPNGDTSPYATATGIVGGTVTPLSLINIKVSVSIQAIGADPVFSGTGTVVSLGNTSANRMTSTLPNIAAGDFVLALVQRDAVSSLTDVSCAGQAMSLVSSVNAGEAGFGLSLYAYRPTNAIPNAAVVASFSSAAAWGSMVTAHWSGVGASIPLAVKSSTGLTGPATTRTIPTALTTSTRALVIAVGTDWDNYNTHTSANGFTKRFDTNVQFIYDYVAPAVPLTIMVNPNGGTVTVSVKVTSGGTYQAVADGNLSGNITAVKMDVLKGPVNAIKFTAASATATIEISQ